MAFHKMTLKNREFQASLESVISSSQRVHCPLTVGKGVLEMPQNPFKPSSRKLLKKCLG